MYINNRNHGHFEGFVGTAAEQKPGRNGKTFVKFSMKVDNSFQDEKTGQWNQGPELWVTVKINVATGVRLVGTGPGKVEVGDKVVVDGSIGVRTYVWNNETRFELFVTATTDNIIVKEKKADRQAARAVQVHPTTPIAMPTTLPAAVNVVTSHDPNGLL
jgi:single-stranded DNA-binding protein